MLASCPGRSRRADRARGDRRPRVPAAWCLAPSLSLALIGCVSGCVSGGSSDGGGGEAGWVIVAAAMLIAAAGGHAWGALRARSAGNQALRAARSEARLAQALHEGWLWQTDAQHRLVTWQGPGRPPGPDCALFDQPELQQRLRTQQAFSGLRVRLHTPVDGSHGWELRALPREDDLGCFGGHAGAARPTDGDDALHTAAAALVPALQAHPAAALLLVDIGEGWRVRQANAAALLLWPGLTPGMPLSAAPESLAPSLAAALLAEGDLGAQGWRQHPLTGLPGDVRGTVLAEAGVGLAADADTDADAAGAERSESDNFSFTVSHDLRAPIRVVEGFTRIVKEDYGRLLDRVGNDHLDRVLGAAARMNLMIDALLTLARLSSQPLARQPVNLSQLAGYVVDDLRRTAPEREAEVEIESDLQTRGDPTLLRLVLENLLGNAWKYSARCPKAHIALASVQHGGRMAYVVRDNGAGFDMRSSERLFGLFQRLHSASEFPGHGVGLASVRRIVRRHGGEIWAEAEPGRGAAFYFTLAG